MSTTPTANPIGTLTGLVTTVTGAISTIVASVHKEAALVLGVLTATGTTPVAAADQKVVTALLVGYAAVCHAAEKLFSSKT